LAQSDEPIIVPNPNSGIFTIKNLNSKAEINVYDLFGKIVKKIIFEPNSPINLDELEKGNYLLEITLPGNMKRLKLVQL